MSRQAIVKSTNGESIQAAVCAAIDSCDGPFTANDITNLVAPQFQKRPRAYIVTRVHGELGILKRQQRIVTVTQRNPADGKSKNTYAKVQPAT